MWGAERLAERALTRKFDALEHGTVTVRFPDGRTQRFGVGDSHANLQIHDPRFYTRVFLSGDLGFAESYMADEWNTDDLPGLLLLLARNRDALGNLDVSTSWLRRRIDRALHRRRRNSLAGSRRNIRDHYDLGNDMFETFLDPTMTYSCAIFDEGDETLEQAQRRKLERILDLAGVRPGDHLLEIGCGWGELAVMAAERGCRVTGITLSEEQKRWCEAKIARHGLEGSVDIRLLDYRRIVGSFDRVVSIEMLEAVGKENLGTFFRTVEGLLRPGGTMALQVITIDDELYDGYSRGSDFIQHHVFPGGHLPSPAALAEIIDAYSDLETTSVDRIGSHYARTLAEWRRRFAHRVEDVLALGYGRDFVRKWLYYFSYCEAGFDSGCLDDLQLVLTNPAASARAA